MSQKLKGMDWRRITFGFKARGEEYGEKEFLSEYLSPIQHKNLILSKLEVVSS